uniref:Uncharacterized protein n=2 Tax=Phaeomonas parva TaxID=124430 RepID=A0A7S1U001_9STRA|mmetsp:Transcript_24714/g.77494  ORF Transcript_24714/g.77494 Transcript_24714/m.77494 type:complete len:103 (+) Transcript_24714:360-668(+)
MYALAHPDVHGLDVRLVNSDAAPSPCFPERGVTDGVIMELQSEGVDAGGAGADAVAVREAAAVASSGKAAAGAHAVGANTQVVGDCWMEVRAMMKRPQKFFR